MNGASFRSRESLLYRVPAALIDLVLMVAIYKLMLAAFPELVQAAAP